MRGPTVHLANLRCGAPAFVVFAAVPILILVFLTAYCRGSSPAFDSAADPIYNAGEPADTGWTIGRNGGQTVDHLHLHLLAGRRMTWPQG